LHDLAPVAWRRAGRGSARERHLSRLPREASWLASSTR